MMHRSNVVALSTIAALGALAACRVPERSFIGLPDDAGAGSDTGDAGDADGSRCARLGLPSVPWPATGLAISAVALADLDGNGKADVVVSQGAHTVSVLRGNGDGSFQPRVDYPTGEGPRDVVVKDVSGDGKLDLVVANVTAGTLSVLLGNGNGTFLGHVEYPAGSVDSPVVVADVTGDGQPDAVVVGATGTVSMLRGNGGGTFQPRLESPVLASRSIAAVDFSGDGRLDLVTANRGGSMTRLLNNGNGTFQVKDSVSVEAVPSMIAVGDVAGDRNPDVVIGSLPHRLAILAGQNDGTFTGSSQLLSSGDPTALTTADLNRDGRADVVLTVNDSSRVANTVSVKFGSDSPFGPMIDYPAPTAARSVAVGDLDGDGTLDLIGAGPGGVLGVLLGGGNGSFQVPASYAARSPFSETGFVSAVGAADVNGDGRLDLVVAFESLPSVVVLLASADQTFMPPTSYPLPASPLSLALADLDGDTRPDLVTADGDGMLDVLRGAGDGSFGPPARYAMSSFRSPIQISDANRDGKLDLVTSDVNAGVVSVLLGNGDGTFQARRNTLVAAGPIAMAVADLSGDGHLDVIALGGDPRVARMWLGQDDASFRFASETPVTGNPFAIAAGDVDGDGKADVVTASATVITVSLSRGDGTLTPAVDYPIALPPLPLAEIALVVIDVDGDGAAEILWTSFEDSAIGLLRSTGDGRFQPAAYYPAGPTPFSIAVADVGGDGRRDVIVNNRNFNKVSVLSAACLP